MNDDQIVEYCRNLIVANLSQYQTPECLSAILDVRNDDKELKTHCEALKELLDACLDILRKRRTSHNDKQK